MDSTDILVIENGGGLRLLEEAIHLLGVMDSGGQERFQSHDAVQAKIFCLIDNAHTSAADFRKNFEVANGLADHESGPLGDLSMQFRDHAAQAWGLAAASRSFSSRCWIAWVSLRPFRVT